MPNDKYLLNLYPYIICCKSLLFEYQEFLNYNLVMLKRIIIMLLILMLNPISSPAEELVKEKYKINGQVEYEDNLIETIYLDSDIEKPEVNIPQQTLTLPAGVINITSNTNSAKSALARSMVNRGSLGDILPLSASVVANAGGLTYGTKFAEELSYAQPESTATFFLRYNTPKHFSFETALRQSANRELEDSQWSSLRITPEWHFNDKLTIKNSFSNYVQSQKNKTELTIVYTPALKKYAEALKFELGIAQTYYSNGNRSEAVSFSTGFRLK